MGNIAVALDIGSSKVCVIIAEMNKKQFNILGVGTSECKGVKKGIIVDIDSTVEAIKNSVKQAEQMSNREVKSVFVNLAGGYTNIYKNKGVIAVSRDDKEIIPEDIKRVMQTARVVALPSDKEIIDVIPEQFIVDGIEGIKDPVGMVGVRLEVDANLIVANCTSVQNIIRSVQKAGFAIDGIILEPLGTSSIVLNEDEKELGVALIDIGAETTDISVFKKGALVYTKLIPVGGNHITNDISIICKISSGDAERIKKNNGIASVDMLKNDDIIKIKDVAGKGDKEIMLSEVTQIIDARLYEIFSLIRRELEDNKLMELLSAGIVFTGGGLFNIKGIQEVIQENFNTNVRFGYPNYIGVASPIYSAAAGIAMYAVKQKKTSTVGANAGAGSGKDHKEDTRYRNDDGDGDGYEDDAPKEGFLKKLKEFFSDFF